MNKIIEEKEETKENSKFDIKQIINNLDDFADDL